MKKLLFSFNYWYNGIAYCFTIPLNYRDHSVLAVLFFLSDILFQITMPVWLLVCMALDLVSVVALPNTVISMIRNHFFSRKNPKARTTKHAVVNVQLNAMFSSLASVLIFSPKVVKYVA